MKLRLSQIDNKKHLSEVKDGDNEKWETEIGKLECSEKDWNELKSIPVGKTAEIRDKIESILINYRKH